jgi:tripartite-type tricarboxylate transporter receptor subunit TctC
MPRVARGALVAGLIAIATASVSIGPAAAQKYPDRPIRVIIPYTAGGVADSIMRLLSPKMEERLGQKLVIEARPGAAGNIGVMEVARAEPDGYKIVVAATNNFVINQFTMKMTLDPLEALTPVAKLADVPLVLFANPSVPARNFTEFLAYARTNPGRITFGSPAAGTVNHLLLERIKLDAGIDMVHVPFRGSPQGVLAVLANEIQLFTVGLAAGGPHLAEGKLVALAVATEKRLPMLPQVGTLIEAGFPGLVGANWWGMAAPKGTPEPILRALDEAVRDALGDPTVIERFNSMGLLVPHETREQFAASLAAEAKIWAEITRRAHIVIQ